MNEALLQPRLSDEELRALLFVLDDADHLHLAVQWPSDTELLLHLWKRLHLTLLARRGDRDAKAMLERVRNGAKR